MKSIEEFPDPSTFQRRFQSLAVLDALLCPDWQFRYFSFNSNWNPGETMGSIRDGSGNEVFAHFSAAGCFIKEYCHEYPSLTSSYELVPAEFQASVQEPAFRPDEVTACYWRSHSSTHWSMNAAKPVFDPDQSNLLAMVDGRPETYEQFASEYYSIDLPRDLITQISEQQCLTDALLDRFRYSGRKSDLRKDLAEAGYPSALKESRWPRWFWRE